MSARSRREPRGSRSDGPRRLLQKRLIDERSIGQEEKIVARSLEPATSEVWTDGCSLVELTVSEIGRHGILRSSKTFERGVIETTTTVV
jgi:hypothetical protein